MFVISARRLVASIVLVFLLVLLGAGVLGFRGEVLAASADTPASQPAASVRIVFVDAQKVLQQYDKSARLEEKLQAVRQEAVAAQLQGDQETFRKIVERLASEREAGIRDLLADVKVAAAHVARRDHYDVVSVNNIYVREGVEVPEVTTEVVEVLHSVLPASMPATATASAPAD